MNVEPYLVADSVALVDGQRLVRRLCNNCREEEKASTESLEKIGFTPEEAKKANVFRPNGCSTCNNTGYKGRTGLFEVMEIKGEIKDLILTKGQAKEIKKSAMQDGMITLRRSGLEKIKEGITSIDEVLRETVKDEEVKNG